MNRIRHLLLFAAVLMHSGLAVSAFPGRPSPQRLVNDLAGLFSASQTESLESRLVAFDDSTSNQITVVTVSDLEGYEPAQFAVKLGEEWGVGTRERDNGIIVLVKPKTASGDGRVTIQVGYGLEGAIPDAYCTRIIRNTMIPHFRNNDYFEGVQAACEELMGLGSGEISEPRGGEEEEGSFASILFIFILFIVLMIVFSKGSGKGSGHNGPGGGRHLYMGPVGRAASLGGLMGGLSGGFSGGSRGGFSGGFGGFGGGSFGGGGASGSW